MNQFLPTVPNAIRAQLFTIHYSQFTDKCPGKRN